LEKSEEIIPRMCDMSSDAGAAVDFFFLVPYGAETAVSHHKNKWATLNLSHESRKQRFQTKGFYERLAVGCSTGPRH
jgi:hypothetical protein